MASVYTNDLRLEEIGSGEQSGTWGDTTNTNLELIAEAFSFGTEASFSSDANATTTLADGATDAIRSLYLKVTSGASLTATRELTIAPNTVSKVWIIENATSGSQSITIKQGSGATVTIPNGQVKMVYSDGAGSGAAVVDALVDLDLTGTTTIAAANISGDLDVDGTANLDVVDIDGAVDMASTLQVDGAITSSSGATITTADNSDTLTLISTDTDASKGPNLVLKRDNNSGAGDDLLGTIDFIGEDAGNNLTSYVTMSTMIQDVTGGSEDGRFQLKIQSGGNSRNVLDITGSNVIHFNSDGEDINFRYDSDTVANALFVDGATGYVSTGTLGSNNVRLGANAGDAIQSTGSSNTLIGDEAGTAITTGDNNVAVGYKALEAEDNYGYNVAVGSESLMTLAATSADAYSTAVGYQSGKLTDSGLYNTFVGAQSGRGNTSASNNVGMGNASLYTNQIGSNNVAIGVQALNTMNPSTALDTHNTAVGYQALQDAQTIIQTTAIGAKALHELLTGNYNVAVGFESLEETTVGDYNTAVGTYALKVNVNGDRSTAIGYGALLNQGPSTATNADYQNVAVGMHAGYNLTTGKKNVFVGYEAGNSDSTNKATGDGNTFVGNEAGHDITSGYHNVLVGHLSGDSITTGYANVAVGYRAMQNNDEGQHNVAIGTQAMDVYQPASAGSGYNVALGAFAGLALSTGAQNTILGGLAGRSLTTENSCTMVGYGAGYYNETGANNTFIGVETAQGLSTAVLTGDHNTCLGYRAGFALQGSAQVNTCLGAKAGESVTTGDGNVFVGYAAGSGQITSADNYLYIARDGTGAANAATWIYGNPSGVLIQGNNSSTWTTSSDRRIKKNIVDATVGLTEINKLKIKNFEYRTKDELESGNEGLTTCDKKGVQLGLIAQEVQEVFPNDVSDAQGNGTLAINPDEINFALIKAVQELSAKVTALEARVATLEGT